MAKSLNILIWVAIILLFLASFIGLAVPVIPGVFLLWGGFILYHFAMDASSLSMLFWIAMGMFTLLLLVADFITNHYFVQKLGGSKRSQWGAMVGVFLGVFIYPPFGIIAVPFIIVFMMEVMEQRTAKEAAYAALGAIIGFLSGAVAKGFIQIVMIILFFMQIYIF